MIHDFLGQNGAWGIKSLLKRCYYASIPAKMQRHIQQAVYICFMRKWLLSLLAICYLFTTAGVGLQWHYCMGALKEVAFVFADSHPDELCSNCGMSKQKHHCCKDELVKTKVSDAHQQSPGLAFQPLLAEAWMPEWPQIPQPINISLRPINEYRANAPPPLLKDRSVLFCVFRC